MPRKQLFGYAKVRRYNDDSLTALILLISHLLIRSSSIIININKLRW